MKTNPDYEDLFREFNGQGVEFIVVGAHALAAHGLVRATKDIDVWIRPQPENAQKVMRALVRFGAPISDLSESDLTTLGTVFQIGVEPVRIDIINQIDGVEFDEAWPSRVKTKYGETPVHVLSRAHLIQNKRSAGRLQDLADITRLESPDDDSS